MAGRTICTALTLGLIVTPHSLRGRTPLAANVACVAASHAVTPAKNLAASLVVFHGPTGPSAHQAYRDTQA